MSGLFVRVDLLHVVFTAGATWFRGRRFGVAVAIALSAVHPSEVLLNVWTAPQSACDVIVNAALGGVTLALALIAAHETKERLAARAEVHVLRGLLPICSYCKRIRSDTNAWERIEKYISEHSEAEFTHGICPACAKERLGIDPAELS